VPKPKATTISRDPYADDPYAFIGTPTKKEEVKAPERPAAKPEPVPKLVTEKITTPYPTDLIERARDAAYWERATLAGIVVQALSDALDRMEKERGEPYPPRKSQLRGGRPVGTGRGRPAGNA
jgi:hypothetical protein